MASFNLEKSANLGSGWSTLASPGSAGFSICYGAGVFVADFSDALYYSSDLGVTWTPITITGLTGSFTSGRVFIQWNGSEFITTGFDSGISYYGSIISTDGINWAFLAFPPGIPASSQPASDPCWYPDTSLWIIGVESGVITLAPAALSWAWNEFTFNSIVAMCYNGGQIIGAIYDGRGDIYSTETTTPDITWSTAVPYPNPVLPSRMVYSHGIYIAIDTFTNQPAISSDGNNFADGSLGSNSYDLVGLRLFDDLFIITADLRTIPGTLYSSSDVDGATWAHETNLFDQNPLHSPACNDIAWNGSLWLAVGTGYSTPPAVGPWQVTVNN